MLHDVFICHASDDKDAFVRPLAERLREQRIEVWYDEFSLKVGDSLRRSIDRGLSQSRFGIVVLSPSFFRKKWSQWELDGLVSRQNSDEAEIILPVWHMVTAQDLLAFSPPLADKIAVQSSLGLDEVVRRLTAIIQPKGSTLVIARDHLLKYGARPPVISDDWWLDVAAASESNDMEGDFQEAMGWGRWGFPLPEFSTEPAERGWRLAYAAMQMTWQREANALPITQVTEPEKIHSFIGSQPGLAEVCSRHVPYLISYAPQLVIRTFGGEYEDEIESRYRRSIQTGQDRRDNGDSFGSALTTDSRSPGCDEMFALRDPEFGNLKPAILACHFVQGDAARSGPSVMYYATIDYTAWLLSEKSMWLPWVIRHLLTTGIAAWGTWPWDSRERLPAEFGFEDEGFTGAFRAELHKAYRLNDLRITADARRDVEHRLAFSSALLQLPEDGIELSERLIDERFLEHYFSQDRFL